MHWGRKWQPTPVFLPGKSQGRESLWLLSMGSHRVRHDWSDLAAAAFIGRTDAEAETPILWPPDAKNCFIGKDPDAVKGWRHEEKGITEDKIVGWYHWLNGLEFEQTPGESEGQRSLNCCSPWGHRDGHNLATEQQLILYIENLKEFLKNCWLNQQFQ